MMTVKEMKEHLEEVPEDYIVMAQDPFTSLKSCLLSSVVDQEACRLVFELDEYEA